MAPRHDRTFIVKTDAASIVGIGGVLSQVDDAGKERVVAYYGRCLTVAEWKYTVTEIELLATLKAIKSLRAYLRGRRFRLVIDHSALRRLHTIKDSVDGGPASRLMRWILKLAEYNFSVEHKPGAAHNDADVVSRTVDGVPSAETDMLCRPLAKSNQESRPRQTGPRFKPGLTRKIESQRRSTPSGTRCATSQPLKTTREWHPLRSLFNWIPQGRMAKPQGGPLRWRLAVRREDQKRQSCSLTGPPTWAIPSS